MLTKKSMTIALATPALLLALAACSVTPSYQRPEVNAPVAYKEAAQTGQWKEAQPSEALARGEWWSVFGDERLDALEREAAGANQGVKAAAARVQQARALLRDARSSLYPQVNATLGANRQRPAPVSLGLPDDAKVATSNTFGAQLGVAYEADLFGRVAAGADAAREDAQQQEALLNSVQLALQADVAQNYFQIRELDAEQAVYGRTVELRAETLKLVQSRYDEGDISELDLARAKSELASAQSEALGVARQRSAAEHALAVLLGKAPADFSQPEQVLQRVAVAIPAGLPSDLLERRPDVAAAEKAMAAANARIGIARAAYFPRLGITGAMGYESASVGDLFKWSTRSFVLGPLLSLPLFDGGRRQAGMERAHAVFEEDAANYRQTVLNAFKEVEDGLAGMRLLQEQSAAQDSALQSAERAADLSHTQYKEGAVSYLNVIDADRTVLQHRRATSQLDGERARAAVNLIRALGGGWNSTQPTQISMASASAAAAKKTGGVVK